MVTKLKIRYFESLALAADATWSVAWTSDENYIIKYIFFLRTDGVKLTKSDVTILIMGDPLTSETALAVLSGVDMETALPINEKLDKATKFEWSFVNREGAAIDITLHLILEKRVRE